MFVFGDFTKKVRITAKDVYPDNIFFRLHYRLTFWFLLGCSILVSSRQFIKEHINCIADKSLEHVINTYCFFSSTFTLLKYHNVSHEYAIHPGVGPNTLNDEVIRHAYYQWVPFVLFGQAIMFVIPHYIWKHCENKRLEKIVTYVRTSKLLASEPQTVNGYHIDSKTSLDEKRDWLSKIYITSSRFKVNRDWAFYLVACEILNAINVVLQIWLVDVFLQGKFMELGSDWWYNKEDALEDVFPKVTKCNYYKYGASGTIQTHDALCVMALNIINEKIYCILWFWFLGLFILNCIGITWRLLTIVLHSRSLLFNKYVWGEISPGPEIPPEHIKYITKTLCFADWLFLYYIGKNVNPGLYREVVSQICSKLPKNKVPSQKLDIIEDPSESESFC